MDIVLSGLLPIERDQEPLYLIQGGAQGADSLAAEWALAQEHVFCDPYPADWDNCGPECRPGHRKTRQDGSEYCPAAGPRRNQQMLDEGYPDLVVAFTDDLRSSKGTRDMVTRAKKSGVRTYVVGRG